MVALIPTFVLVGPLSFLAWLLPAVFGGLALVLRRWRVLLAVAGLDSLLYLAHGWLRGSLADSWWGSQPALWGTLSLVALVGAAWSWRHRSGLTQAESMVPARGEQVLLWLVSVLGLASVLFAATRGTLLTPPGRDLLAVWIVAWVGALWSLAARLWPAAHRGIWTEPVMLAVLVGVCIALGTASRPSLPPAGVAVVWTFAPPERGAILSSPVVAGNRIYVAALLDIHGSTQGAVYCIDRDTGRPLWKFDDAGQMQQVYSTPCLAGGRLYIGEGMHANFVCKLYCLEAATGRRLWAYQTAGHIESSPMVVGDRVFFGSGDDGLYCLDCKSGALRWHFQEPLHIDSSPQVIGQYLYASSGVSRRFRTTEVLCLDVETGKVCWRVPTEYPAWGSPAVDGEQVFIGTGHGRLDDTGKTPSGEPAGALLCLSAQTGRPVRWEFRTAAAVLVRPALDHQHVYFGTRDGTFFCLDRHDGRLCWQHDLGSPVLANPALIAGRLYVVTRNGRVWCMETTGSVRWTFDVAAYTQTQPQLLSSPAVVADPTVEEPHYLIYFGSELANAVSSSATLFCLLD
jgi:outer membrane protein assembly factor BamB